MLNLSNLSIVPCPLAMDRQDEIIPEHPNNSNIRCSPQDKRCIQKTLARHPPKSTNQRSNTAREETKAALVRETIVLTSYQFHRKQQSGATPSEGPPRPQQVFYIKSFIVPQPQAQQSGYELYKLVIYTL